jgi:transposase-like protein
MFKLAMGDIAPKNIITYEDTGMKAAIDAVFPEANHRNCRWHVIRLKRIYNF